MTHTHNPYCDGAHCAREHGEVRVYPLGAGGNLILCRSCWDYENRYRWERGEIQRSHTNWPQVDWDSSEVYGWDSPTEDGKRYENR